MVTGQPWQVMLTKRAAKDAKLLTAAKLKAKTEALLQILLAKPFQNPPPYEKLCGELNGRYSRRINLQHRLVYEVLQDQHLVKIICMWTHYE